MVLPIGDAPNPRGTPVVTYLLIVVNVAVYVLVTLPLSAVRPDPTDPLVVEYVNTVARALEGRASVQELLANLTGYDLFVFQWGFRPVAPGVVPLFASMFLHAGFLHLFGNMLFLWIYGDNVEHRLGPVRYLVWYLLTGMAATGFQTVASPDSPIPMIGASGAISGVLGFYFVWFPHNQVRLLWFLPPFVMDVFEVRARLVLGLYLVMDNLLPFLIMRSATGVAHGAHIGGFIAGLAAAWVMNRRAIDARPREYAHAEPMDGPDSLGAAIDAGRFAEAAEAYFRQPAAATRGALGPDRALKLAAWLRDNGHSDAALTLLRRLLREPLDDGWRAEALVAAGGILLEDMQQATTAYQYFLDALDLDPPSDVALRARRALASIEARQKRQVGHLHTPHAW
jgi:membrane associated rhomboid family serine protease